MIQEINLYQPIFRKEKPTLHAVSMAYITVAAVALFAVLGVGLMDQLETKENALAKQEKSVGEMQEQLEIMRANHVVKEKDPNLQTVISMLEMELEQKRALFSRLANTSLGQKSGFSSLLAGFARQVVDGLWLRELEIKSGGENLKLEGSSTNAELVPAWLAGLRNESALLGKEFNYVVLVSRTDVVDFSISTERPVDISNGAQAWLKQQKQVAGKMAEVGAMAP